MKDKGKFVKCQSNSKMKARLRSKFINSRHIFDKAMKKAKREYEKDQVIKFENIDVKNPK